MGGPAHRDRRAVRIVQKPGSPMSIFLVAEDEREEVLVSALRESTASLQVHRMFSEDGYDEFIREPAQNELDSEHVALEMLGEHSDLWNQVCREHPGRGSVGAPRYLRRECPRCQQELEARALEKVVELEISVPCACWPDCDEGPSFNAKTGHVRRCLIPRAKALGMVSDE